MTPRPNWIPSLRKPVAEPSPHRCHVRQMRGRELVSCVNAIRAFVIDGREVPTCRREWGTAATAIDREGNMAWSIAAGNDVLIVAATDMVTVVVDMEEAGYDVVPLRPAA